MIDDWKLHRHTLQHHPAVVTSVSLGSEGLIVAVGDLPLTEKVPLSLKSIGLEDMGAV